MRHSGCILKLKYNLKSRAIAMGYIVKHTWCAAEIIAGSNAEYDAPFDEVEDSVCFIVALFAEQFLNDGRVT